MTGKDNLPDIDRDFFLKYDRPGPRYTSYPTAPYFSESYTQEEAFRQIDLSNSEGDRNISLYFHIPFCPRRCHYCGCTTECSQKTDYIENYISALVREMEIVGAHVDKTRKVTMIHWGGGTPNSLHIRFIEQVMNSAAKIFSFADQIETAMECEPSLLTEKGLTRLYDAGINRLSFGIQDLKLEVLKIVNRSPSKMPVDQLIAASRARGFKSINLDFIYGLPGQTIDSFRDTIEQAAALRPDRLVTFSYAHVPWVKEHQKILEKVPMPSPEEKISMLINTLGIMHRSGYAFIGMDHFALETDPLSIALKDRALHRNFQGYTTRSNTGQVLAFGSSGISQLHHAYIQNHKTSEKYMEAVGKGELPLERGLTLTPENIFRRHIINEIMCNSRLSIKDLGRAFFLSDESLLEKLEAEFKALEVFEKDGLVELDLPRGFTVTPRGRMIVRNIAMLFDPMLKDSQIRYSRTV